MTQPIPKGISNIDPLVKDVLRQFLSADSMIASSATNKLFQEMMNDKKTWEKIAKSLHIKPQSPETAKAEAVARLQANKNFVIIFKQYKSTGREIKKLDPVALNDKIAELIHSTFATESNLRDLLRREYDNALHRITSKSGTKEGVDPIDMEMALILIKHGITPYSNDSWRLELERVVGFKSSQDYAKHIYCPEHLVLFKELLQKLHVSPWSNEKQYILEHVLRYGFIDEFPREYNYPYNFFEEALKTGVRPSVKLFDDAQHFCPLDLWDKKEGSPIAQLLKFATDAERNAVLQKSQSWFQGWQKALSESLVEMREMEWINKYMHKIINWPVFTAVVQRSEVNEKERQANLYWVNQEIVEAEKAALSKAGSDPNTVKTYFDSIRECIKGFTAN